MIERQKVQEFCRPLTRPCVRVESHEGRCSRGTSVPVFRRRSTICRGGLCGIRPPPRTDTGDDCSTYRFKGESITSYFTHYHSGGDNQRQPMISPLRLLSCGAASFQPGRRPPTVDGRLKGGPAPPRWPTGPVAVTWNVFHWKPIVYDPGKEGGVSPAVARRSVA